MSIETGANSVLGDNWALSRVVTTDNCVRKHENINLRADENENDYKVNLNYKL